MQRVLVAMSPAVWWMLEHSRHRQPAVQVTVVQIVPMVDR